ncbi:MAG: HD domain-containing protein [Lachnospiraceae bacterium]|nr:HD domain-containing protein [Lachnospiraceae bacterium]
MRNKAIKAFKKYSNRYDVADIKIKLKIDHTYRVAEIAGQIGVSVGADPDFAWLLGLLHDIGRFEQLTQYGTFKDAESVDHAELGADILFHDGLIGDFPEEFFVIPGADGGESERRKMAETAIRLHNKLTLSEGLDADTLLYCKVLRDADKTDIMRVLTEPPYDERNGRIIKCSGDGTEPPAREDVMRCVHEHRCVPKTFERTDFESLISQCCMCFELEYPVSRKIVRKQGYLDILMNLAVQNETMKQQLATLRSEMKQAWDYGRKP